VYNRREHDASRSRSHQPEPTEASVEYGGLNLIDQYLALVLAVLTEAGLLDVRSTFAHNYRHILTRQLGLDLYG
jgi:hypothetical protein